MKTSDFDYYLPDGLIAQTPAEPRDSSRLLVFDRKRGDIAHRMFRDLTEYLTAGDVLVVNNTKVMPARLYGVLNASVKAEVLLLKRLAYNRFEALMRPARRARIGSKIRFSDGLSAEVEGLGEDGARILEFTFDGVLENVLDEIGEMPLPHYIKTKLTDKSRYQTVYCKIDGSAAAPTAGLHFTEELLKKLKDKGVVIAEVLLNVGPGTFRPVKTEDVSEHKMHAENYEISAAAAAVINAAKREGRRVIAVGTTSVRAIESAAEFCGTEPPESRENKDEKAVGSRGAEPCENFKDGGKIAAGLGGAEALENDEKNAGNLTQIRSIEPRESGKNREKKTDGFDCVKPCGNCKSDGEKSAGNLTEIRGVNPPKKCEKSAENAIGFHGAEASKSGYYAVSEGSGETRIFIYPPYKFKIADALITNFHLPKSSLIMLVSAFAGYENTMKIYETAVKEKYRFFSFGDATLII